jgi:hypothetical protein
VRNTKKIDFRTKDRNNAISANCFAGMAFLNLSGVGKVQNALFIEKG